MYEIDNDIHKLRDEVEAKDKLIEEYEKIIKESHKEY